MNVLKSFKKNILYFFLLTSSVVLGQEINKSIYLIGNTGTTDETDVLSEIIKDSKKTDNSILLLLGNSVNSDIQNKDFEKSITHQLNKLSSFSGEVFFMPGKNEWAIDGHKGVRSIEKHIQKNSTSKFYPDDGEAIKHKDISENIVLITVDTQWFLEDWNTDNYINDDSQIKNRTLFFLEFENRIKKAHGKIILVALHHPVDTNTKQGLLSKVGGIKAQDFENKEYRKLRNRLKTIGQSADNIIFISGKDKNLQYINDGIPQIISGAVGETKNVTNVSEADFGLAENGYAKLEIDNAGAVIVKYYTVENGVSNAIFKTEIIKGHENDKEVNYTFKDKFPETQSASIYTKEAVKKSSLYKTLWGKHYREHYGTDVNVPVVLLDTLMGGLSPIKRGGGQQSKSLRLEDKNGKQFVMRAIKKSTAKFLQANVFPDAYLANSLDDTAIDKFLSDFYTTSNPYAAFAIGDLSSAVKINHTNPVLYYIPKQKTLGVFNDDFGDELYMIEEHVGSTQIGLKSFGTPTKILSTSDVLQEIHKTGKSVVDEPSYIKARLFDMLLGDWDRHEDQWRWALFEDEDGTSYCKPIPRDRDQAFSKYDGALISFLTRALPSLRKMQSYDEEIRSVKWLASSPYHLDLMFVNASGWNEWEKQAKYIQDNLKDSDIEKAFEAFPSEIKGEEINDIKEKLKGRQANLINIAKAYYEYLNKFEVVVGTQKSDKFSITRLPNGETSIKIDRKDLGLLNRTFSHDVTKEIWVYGLDGKDTFVVDGEGNDLIKIRIVGGKKNDTYDFKNTKKVKLYDYKSKENTIVNKKSKKWLVDDYEINNYDHKKVKHNFNQILPLLGFNPDDGLEVGIINNFTYYGLQRNKFTYKHSISAGYYTGNSGFDLSYKGEFSNIFHNWNFGVEAKYTSPNFAQNYFGIGNETTYDKDDVELDFNRVSIKKLGAAISLIWNGRDGGSFYFKPLIETFEVDTDDEDDRFINDPILSGFAANATLFDKQTYFGSEVSYSFKNKNDIAYPTMGLDLDVTAGYKTAIDGNDDNAFAYIKPHIAITHKLNKSASLVLATKIGGEAILGDDFELYHAAQIGGAKNLRGYRKERFIGKYSLFQSTDIRCKIGNLSSGIIPMKYGITGGFDYGRVWIEDDNSDKWHNSIGGSFWVSGLETFTLNAGYYSSDDGGIISVLFGFAF
ncbi:MAG: metallophosphatase [Algibacter sp.]